MAAELKELRKQLQQLTQQQQRKTPSSQYDNQPQQSNTRRMENLEVLVSQPWC
jgi:hypothetical protein